MSDPTTPRIPPLPKERWDDEVKDALRVGFPSAAKRILAEDGKPMPVPNVLGTLLNNPQIAGPFLQFNRVLLEKPSLGHRLREVLVLRVAWRTKAPYEWVQHTLLGVQVGLSADEIRAIIGDLDAWKGSALELDLLRATDQMLDGYRVDDATWARLAKELDERQLIEVIFTVGTYTMLAMAFNSFGLQLDPGLAPPDGLPIPEPELG